MHITTQWTTRRLTYRSISQRGHQPAGIYLFVMHDRVHRTGNGT